MAIRPLVLSVAASALLAAPQPYAATATPPAPEGCSADASWVTNPAIPNDIPNGKQATHCNVHQYAWAAFIATMNPTGDQGEAEFESWMPFYGMFQRGTQPPLPWGTMPTITKDDCANLDQLEKVGAHKVHSIAKPFTDITGQAGSIQPLYDQNGNIVYYEMRINHPLYNFFDACDLYRSGCVKEGVRPKDLFFPNQATEIKLSWKKLTAEEARSGRFYTSRVVVQTDARTKQCAVETMGMVGYHLTTSTTSHPEMVWATFEQVDNNPLCSNRATATPPNGKGWSFYNTDKAAKDLAVNTYLGETTPAQVCLEYEAGSTAEEQQNIAAVHQLNASVHALKGLPALLQHYQLVGSIYTKGGEVPPYKFLQTGSTMLSNTTMETYTQNGVVAGANDNVSCFSCHTYTTNQSPLDMSHLIQGRVSPNSGGCESGSLPKWCLDTYHGK